MKNLTGFLGISASALLLGAVAGCGGSGASANSSGPVVPAPVDSESRLATALVNVDVSSGNVVVTPQEGDGRAVFSGGAFEVTTSRLIEDSGDITKRVIRATLKNATNESTFADTQVSIRSIAALGSLPTDSRSNMRVSTFAGTGGPGGTEGQALSVNLDFPGPIWHDAQTKETFFVDNTRLCRIKDGFVSTLRTVSDCKGLVGDNANLYLTSGNGVFGLRRTAPLELFPVAGSSSTSGFTDGSGASARFSNPRGLDILGNGSLVIADRNNDAIRLIQNPNQGEGGSNVQTVPGAAPTPLDVAVMSTVGDGEIIGAVTGGDNRVFIFDTNGFRAQLGSTTAGGNNGNGVAARFFTPIGITTVGNSFFIADADNFQVRQAALVEGGAFSSPISWHVSQLAGAGTTGAGDGPGNTATFATLSGITASGSGELLVADSGALKVRRVESSTGSFPIFSGTGGGGGTVRVGNADIVRQFGNTTSTTGTEYVFNTGQFGPGLSKTEDWAFSVPAGVSSFQFLVTVYGSTNTPGPLPAAAGTGSSQVFINTLAGVLAQARVIDGPVSNAGISSATAIAVDRIGTPFFVDRYVTTSCVRVIRGLGGQVHTIINKRDVANTAGVLTGANFGPLNITGLWVNEPGDSLILGTTSGIYYAQLVTPTLSEESIVNPENWKISLIAGDHGIAGNTDGIGIAARVTTPSSFIGNGNEFYFVSGSHSVRRLSFLGGDKSSPTSWRVSLFAGNAASGTNDGSTLAARFNNIAGLAFGPDGNILVVDGSNHSIRNISRGSLVTTFAGLTGTSGYVDSAGTAARFNQPRGIAVDSYGFAYITEDVRLRRLSPDGVVRTVVRNAPYSDGTGNVAGFSAPRGLAVQFAGDVIVADRTTIRKVSRIVQRN